jgi:hypothetical protein
MEGGGWVEGAAGAASVFMRGEGCMGVLGCFDMMSVVGRGPRDAEEKYLLHFSVSISLSIGPLSRNCIDLCDEIDGERILASQSI